MRVEKQASNSPTSTVADAIENTLEWLDRQGQPEPGHERRRSQRNQYRVEAKIAAAGGPGGRDEVFRVSTRNVSRTGMSFLHQHAMNSGQQLDIQLPLPDKSSLHFVGRVVRVRHVQGQVHEIGVEFTELEIAIV